MVDQFLEKYPTYGEETMMNISNLIGYLGMKTPTSNQLSPIKIVPW